MNRSKRLSVSFAWICIILLFALAHPATTFAASPYYKEVCASGCAYPNVQSAIDSITDSGPDKVYTVFVDSGVLESDVSITSNGKSYINFVGRGMGTSILRASTLWFQNLASGTTSPDFFDLYGSSNITIRNLSIDARTKDPGGLVFSFIPSGVRLEGDKILIDSAEIQGLGYALWEITGNASRLIQVFNSKVRGVNYGILLRASVWHIFSSDIRAVDDGTSSFQVAAVIGITAGTTNLINSAVWGSHIHAETSVPGKSYEVEAVAATMQSGSTLSIVGSTLHVKITTTNTLGTRPMHSLFLRGEGKVNLIGSDLLYQNTGNLNAGRLGGIGFFSGVPTLEVNLVGVNIIDGGGTGASYRADITGQAGTLPTIRNVGSKIVSTVAYSGGSLTGIGTLYKTINNQSGTASFSSSGTLPGTLPVAMPDATYQVALSASASETVWVTNKTTTGFTLNSSKPNSTAFVDWVVSR